MSPNERFSVQFVDQGRVIERIHNNVQRSSELIKNYSISGEQDEVFPNFLFLLPRFKSLPKQFTATTASCMSSTLNLALTLSLNNFARVGDSGGRAVERWGKSMPSWISRSENKCLAKWTAYADMSMFLFPNDVRFTSLWITGDI